MWMFQCNIFRFGLACLWLPYSMQHHSWWMQGYLKFHPGLLISHFWGKLPWSFQEICHVWLQHLEKWISWYQSIFTPPERMFSYSCGVLPYCFQLLRTPWRCASMSLWHWWVEKKWLCRPPWHGLNGLGSGVWKNSSEILRAKPWQSNYGI